MVDINNNLNEGLIKGSWDNLPIKNLEKEKLPQIVFEFDKEVIVEFEENFVKPIELVNTNNRFNNRGGVYYLFHCKNKGVKKIFFASAWTLLKGLKHCGLLAGKKVKITKKMIFGKQEYEVIEIINTHLNSS